MYNFANVKSSIAHQVKLAIHQFADIVGFTAWSSVREPTHVFRLLEALYSSFDEIAVRRRVFKVETVGDCKSQKTSRCPTVLLDSQSVCFFYQVMSPLLESLSQGKTSKFLSNDTLQ